MNKIINSDALEALRTLPDSCCRTCITSPPYYGLRDYGADGQIGLEDTPDQYIENLVKIFREVRRVLNDDGTLWVNIGDSYTQKNLNGIPWLLPSPSDRTAGISVRTLSGRNPTPCRKAQRTGQHEHTSTFFY